MAPLAGLANVTAVAIQNARLHQTTAEALDGTAGVVGKAIEARDPYTSGHQQRVAQLATAIANEMSLSADQAEGLRIAAMLHDIGKISIPAETLSRPGKLSTVEYRLIQAHPQTGYDLLEAVPFPQPVAEIVLQHHERLDGSGYPRGLSAPELLLEARILAVSDVVEAMASHRPYRPALGIEVALAEIEKNKGTLYDAAAVEACLAVFRAGFHFEPGSEAAAIPASPILRCESIPNGRPVLGRRGMAISTL